MRVERLLHLHGFEDDDQLARLDSLVREAGGRLYPAKDGRMPAAMFQAGYADGLPAFKAQVDPGCSSDFWRRVTA